MKLLIALALIAAVVARPDGAHYEKYDNFNVDEVTSNNRLLKAYTHCFIGDGKCTPEGNDVKSWIPEATATSCGKCTEKQKVVVAKFIAAIKEKLPAEYNILLKKSDPDNKHADTLKKFLDKYAH